MSRSAVQSAGGTHPHPLPAGPSVVSPASVQRAISGRALAYGALFSAPLWAWGYLALFVVGRWAA